MTKDQMIDGCWYIVILGMQGENATPLKFRNKPNMQKHMVHFDNFKVDVHISRVRKLLTKKDHPEYYL